MANIILKTSDLILVSKFNDDRLNKHNSTFYHYQEQPHTSTTSLDTNKTSKILTLQFIPLALFIGLVFIQRKVPNLSNNTSLIPLPTPATPSLEVIPTTSFLKDPPIVSFRFYLAIGIIICGTIFFIICFFRVIRVFKTVYSLPSQVFTNLHTAIYSTTEKFKSIALLILNPSVITEKLLEDTFEITQGELETAEYLTNAGALNILAQEHNIYLTASNNNSFVSLPDGRVIINVNITKLIFDKVFELIAAQTLQNTVFNTSDSENTAYPFPGAYAASSLTNSSSLIKSYASTLQDEFKQSIKKTIHKSSKNAFIVKLLAHSSTPIILRESLVLTTSNTINNRVLKPGLSFIFNKNHRLNPVQKLIYPIQNIIKNIQNKLHSSNKSVFNNLTINFVNLFKTNILSYLAPVEGRWRTCVTFLLDRIPSTASQIFTYVFMWLLTRHYIRPFIQYLLSKAISYNTAQTIKKIYSTDAGKRGIEMKKIIQQGRFIANSTKDFNK
jgi:hypothetical protein